MRILAAMGTVKELGPGKFTTTRHTETYATGSPLREAAIHMYVDSVLHQTQAHNIHPALLLSQSWVCCQTFLLKRATSRPTILMTGHGNMLGIRSCTISTG